MLFSCLHGGNRTVPSWTQSRLLDINLCRKTGSWTFKLQWSRIRQIPYRQDVSLAFSISKKTRTRHCLVRVACLACSSSVTSWSTEEWCIGCCIGSSAEGFGFLVSRLAWSWPFDQTACRPSYWDILDNSWKKGNNLYLPLRWGILSPVPILQERALTSNMICTCSTWTTGKISQHWLWMASGPRMYSISDSEQLRVLLLRKVSYKALYFQSWSWDSSCLCMF
jgi:hypothetical protein